MVAPSLRSLGTVVAVTTASPSFAAPAGAVSTDVILVGIFLDDGRNTIAAGGVPTGFTLAPNLRQVNDAAAGSPSHSLYVYWGRFSDVGAGPYGFTVTTGGGGASFVEGRTAAVKDCILTGNPFEATSGATSGATNVTTAPSVSATSLGTDRYAFYCATNWTGGLWTPATGFTEQWDANDEILTFDDLALPTAQTVTPQAVCAGSGRSNAWVGILLPVPPASSSATPAPIVITTTRPAATTQPITLRSTLVDPPVLTTAAPLVVTGPAPRPVANRGYTWRNTLADPPVLTTPAPIIGETSGRPAPINPAIIGRSSLVDVVVPPAATPTPIVVTAVVRPVPGTAVVGRSTLADPPVLTTPQPLIVSTPAVPVLPPQPVLVRSSLFDAATPAPLVVTPPARAPIVTPALIARSSLIDLATPTPLVVTAPWTPPRAGQTLLFRSSLADAVPAPPLATVPLVITTPWSRPHVSRPAMIRSSLVDVPVVVLPGQISGSAVGLGGMEEAGAVSATESASSALSAGIQ